MDLNEANLKMKQQGALAQTRDKAIRVILAEKELRGNAHRYHRMTLGATEAWSFVEHTHDETCDFCYVVSGTLHETVNGQERLYETGYLIWTRCRDRHSIRMRGADVINLDLRERDVLRIIGGLFGGHFIRDLHALAQPPVVHVPSDVRERLVEDFDVLFRAGQGPRAAFCLDRLLVRLYTDFFSTLAETDTGPRADMPPWLAFALPEIDRRLENGLTMAQLVALCDRTPEHVARSFRAHLGINPSKYLNQQKLERGALLLAHTNRSLRDISRTLGFGSVNYFHRLFKERYGCTPAAYRRESSSMVDR